MKQRTKVVTKPHTPSIMQTSRQAAYTSVLQITLPTDTQHLNETIPHMCYCHMTFGTTVTKFAEHDCDRYLVERGVMTQMSLSR